MIFAETGSTPKFTQNGWLGAWRMLDITTGGTKYAFHHLLKLGYQLGNENKETGNSRHQYRLEFTYKDFSESSSKDGGQLLSVGNTTAWMQINWTVTGA